MTTRAQGPSERYPESLAEINLDAEKLGISEGQMVKVTS